MQREDTRQWNLRVRFWGVRGAIPSPGPETAVFGGNTPCVEIATPGLRDAVVLDAGSGIRPFGDDLAQRPRQPDAVHVFFSHFHWDHVQGLPFFGPLFLSDKAIRLHAACEAGHLQRTLAAQMSPPFCPVPLDDVASQLQFCELSPEGTRLGDLTITPFRLHHPQGCSGFRLAAGGRFVVYATDFEFGAAEYDAVLYERCSGADLLICDAQYTVEEEGQRRGWGHSSWRAATEVAIRAGVRQLVLFHHDPRRSDAQLAAIVDEARARFPNSRAAREGEIITV